MGTLVYAQCGCGYKTENFALGGGMENFQTYCGFPYLCPTCREVTVANYLDATPSCDSCGTKSITSYATRALMGEREKGNAFDKYLGPERGTLTLPQGTYLCPKCEKKTLRFEWGGMWD